MNNELEILFDLLDEKNLTELELESLGQDLTDKGYQVELGAEEGVIL